MRFLAALALLLPLLPSLANARGPDGSFFLGYNQPWFAGNYGTDLTKNFSPAPVRRDFRGIHQNGGRVARIFLFTALQGIRFPGGVPEAVSPRFLRNLETVLDIARENHVKVYVTLLNPSEANEIPNADFKQFYRNVFLNPSMTNLFNQIVLGPVLKVLDRNRDAVFALDLANEIDALTNRGFASFDQVRLWVWNTATFVKTHSPWLRKTVSVGWGGAQYLVTQGYLTGLKLDFYDLHAYSDSGTYSGATALCSKVKADGMTIILGEFGQKSRTVDDNLQYQSTYKFLATAYSLCFSGALAWDFEDAHEPWFTFLKADGSVRPAALLIKNFPQPRPK